MKRIARVSAALVTAALVTSAANLAPAGAADPSVRPEAVVCWPSGMPAGNTVTDPPAALPLVGAFDLAACGEQYRTRVLTRSEQTNGLLPDVRRSRAGFVGIDGLYYASQDDVYGWRSSDRPTELGANATASCAPADSWNRIVAAATAADPAFDPTDPDKNVVSACANVSYLNTFLYGPTGLFRGVRADRFLRTVPSRVKVGGQSRTVLTWTRGYLLLKYGNPCTDCGNRGVRQFRGVIDAGSSGTRLSLYRVTSRPNGYPAPTWRVTLENDDEGIDDYANPDRSQRPGSGDVNLDVIDPLLEQLATEFFAGRNLPGRTTLRIDVLATAGMREARAKYGAAAVTALYDSIRSNLRRTDSAPAKALAAVSRGSSYAPGTIRTIDGNTQEGVWTWVNLNDYYCNYFDNPKGTVDAACRNVPGGYLGVVEVGGASTQVSFPVAARRARGFVHQVTLNGRNLRVYNKTFLGLGVDSARRTMALP